MRRDPAPEYLSTDLFQGFEERNMLANAIFMMVTAVLLGLQAGTARVPVRVPVTQRR